MTRLQKIFVVLFFALLVLPYPLYWGAKAVGLVDVTNYENRILSTWKDVQDAPLREKPQMFEEFLGDHAAFRNPMMKLNAGINLRVFGMVQNGEVLLGREDWLFYKNSSDSNNLDDYQGLSRYSADQIVTMAAQVQEVQDALAAQGTQFVLLIAPSKENIYKRYMPDTVPCIRTPTKVDELAQALTARTTAKVVYPQQMLIEASETQRVYYQYDTHWNDAGALLASQEVQRTVGRTQGPIFSMQIVPDDNEPLQDLAILTVTKNWLTPDVSFGVDPAPQPTLVDEKSPMNKTYTGHGEGTLLMLHDSFGDKMRPLLADEYANAAYVHHNALTDVIPYLQAAPDVFVLEVAERYTDKLFIQLAVILDILEGKM